MVVLSHISPSESFSSKPSLRHRFFSTMLKSNEDKTSSSDQPVEQSPDASTTIIADLNGSSAHHLDQDTQGHSSVKGTPSSYKHRRLIFHRRKANQSTVTESSGVNSAMPHSSMKLRQRSLRPKSSFFARVVHSVVPCVRSGGNFSPSEAEDARQLPVNLGEVALQLTEKGLQPQDSPEQDTVSDQCAPATIQPTALTAVDLPSSFSSSDCRVTSGSVQPPGSTGAIDDPSHKGNHLGVESDASDDDAEDPIFAEQALEEKLIRLGGNGIPLGLDGLPQPLLPPIAPEHIGRKCLVLDLDETLVHSSFKPVHQADFIVPVEIEYHWHHFHVLKRPGVDNFLKRMGEIYEVVVFTASLSKYADPVLDKLDTHHAVAHRLFRESCFHHKGNYIKDLSQLGRPIEDTIILDNSPASYIFHPNNAVPVSSWFNDPHDAELTDLIPFLADLTFVSDVRGILDGAR